jgi:hypothetical protein
VKFSFGFFPFITVVYHQIAEELGRRFPGATFSGYVLGRRWHGYLRDTGFPYSRLELLNDYIADHWADFQPDLKHLQAMEREYGIPNLWPFVTADRYICRYPYQDILKMIQAHLRFFDRFFAAERPDVVVAPAPAGMSSYISYAMARRMGIPYLPLERGPVPGTVRFHHPDGKIPGLKERYERYLKRPLSSEEHERVEGFLAEFCGNSKKLRYTGPAYARYLRPPRLWFNPLRLIRHATDYYLVERGRDFSMPTVGDVIAGKLTGVSRRVLVNLLRLFELPRENEPFVLFPLQTDPEATTLVHAPFYVDQAAVAENVARSLPIGYKLYVKEHPMVNFGYKPLSVYRRLRKIANVRLIAPHVDSHELIRRSSAVVVIYSTVGLEAISYEKPLVVLGESYLKDFDGAYYAHAITGLPEVLRQALSTYHPDRKRTMSYLLAVLDSAYPGRLDYPYARTDPENLSLLTDAVLQESGLASL